MGTDRQTVENFSKTQKNRQTSFNKILFFLNMDGESQKNKQTVDKLIKKITDKTSFNKILFFLNMDVDPRVSPIPSPECQVGSCNNHVYRCCAA